MLTSCNALPLKTIKIDESISEYKISLSKYNSFFRYNLSYKDNSFNFNPVDGSLPISFSYENGKWVSDNNGIKYQTDTDLITPLPLLISKAIALSLDKEISPDSNGVYKLYGSLREGEYVLTLNDKGRLKNLTIDSIKFNVDFF